MFRKIFKSVKDKLFNTSKKDNPAKPISQTFDVPVKLVQQPEPTRYRGTNVQNPPGSKRKPPTWMPSPDSAFTQMGNGSIDYQIRHKRADRNQMNGRFYHHPWPFKKEVAHV